MYKEESGIIDPFFNDKTGIKVIGTYVRDEHRYLIKESQVSYIADKFSLSFYNNLGFSYIVNTDGDVLIRTNHKNANRTFQNLFDIIDLEKIIMLILNRLKTHWLISKRELHCLIIMIIQMCFVMFQCQ